MENGRQAGLEAGHQREAIGDSLVVWITCTEKLESEFNKPPRPRAPNLQETAAVGVEGLGFRPSPGVPSTGVGWDAVLAQ